MVEDVEVTVAALAGVITASVRFTVTSPSFAVLAVLVKVTVPVGAVWPLVMVKE